MRKKALLAFSTAVASGLSASASPASLGSSADSFDYGDNGDGDDSNINSHDGGAASARKKAVSFDRGKAGFGTLGRRRRRSIF